MPRESLARRTDEAMGPPMPTRPRLLILANQRKTPVVRALEEFRPWLDERAEVVGVFHSRDLHREMADSLPEADLGLVFGGDGTMLAQARALADRHLPLLGINFGKLGFLAEFSIESVKRHWDAITGGGCRVSRRMMLQVDLFPAGASEYGNGDMPDAEFSTLAMNDAVINAGPPFRMVELGLAIDPRDTGAAATSFAGDGIIVSTPSGSTAYNLAAGGPIISPGVDAVAVAAICPQSLAFRPIVIDAASDVWMLIHRANPGMTLVIDGQERTPIERGQQVRVRRHTSHVELLHNPDFNYWTMLAHKMKWAAKPQRMGD